jgi:hypothetical protein
MQRRQRIGDWIGKSRGLLPFSQQEREWLLLHIGYLIYLDMLPPLCVRRKSAADGWLGLGLFLPLYLFVLWKLFAG